MSGASTSDTSARRPANRRALILSAAVDLFHRHGYPATGVDDIGSAVDVSGPAIYRHFDSKEEILLEAIRLAADEVHAANEAARLEAAEPTTLLERYIRAYAKVAIQQSALIAVWTSEARHLNPARRSPMTRRLASWHGEWVDQLLVVRPEIDTDTAGLLVSAAIGLISTAATAAPADADNSVLEDRITAMALATLHTRFD